jgi:hypothetical protein
VINGSSFPGLNLLKIVPEVSLEDIRSTVGLQVEGRLPSDILQRLLDQEIRMLAVMREVTPAAGKR